MGSITITIADDAEYARMQDAVCAIMGYDPNGTTTKDQQVQQHMCNFLKDTVSSHENAQAYQQAMANVVPPTPITLV